MGEGAGEAALKNCRWQGSQLFLPRRHMIFQKCRHHQVPWYLRTNPRIGGKFFKYSNCVSVLCLRKASRLTMAMLYQANMLPCPTDPSIIFHDLVFSCLAQIYPNARSYENETLMYKERSTAETLPKRI